MLLPTQMRVINVIASLLLSASLVGQITIDRSVVLSGGQYVSGLEAPVQLDQALNASTLQTAGYLYCEANGMNALTATLLPAPDQLRAGMSIHLLIALTNSDSVSIEINTFPAVPVLKGGYLKLDSADLLAGMIVQLVYDGGAFQMLSARERPRRPCPSGFSEINSQYCIELNERANMDFPDAAEVCGNLGGKLCSWAEFYYACERDTVFGLNDMVGDYEWTNSAANADDHVRVAGWNNCRSAGTTATISATPRTFRCCYRR